MNSKKSNFSGALRVAGGTALALGAAMTLAMVLGVATTAFAANGDNFILGQNNVATAITRLAGAVGVDGPMLRIDNNNAGVTATALDLQVEPGKAPLKVNATAGKATNLDADRLDGHDAECPAGTRLFLGACWEETRRPQSSTSTQSNAMSDCTDEGRYLPHVLESRAYAQQFRGSTDADVLEWTQTRFSEDGLGVSGFAVSRAGGTAIEDYQALHPYRCVAPLVR